MTFDDHIFTVERMRPRTRRKTTLLPAEAHGAAQLAVDRAQFPSTVLIDPFCYQGDDRIRSTTVELSALRVLESGDVARELYNGDLHAKTDAEVRNIVNTRIVNRNNFV